MSKEDRARTALVTGAGRGIGRAIAVDLGGAGFNVVINYHRQIGAANDCASQVREAGGTPLVIQADISEKADRQRLLDQAVDGFGPIELLVNNAGVAPQVRADLLQMSEDSYDNVLGTNLKGPFFLTQRVACHMIEHDCHGAIINIGSISAFAASINRGEYCIAKAGIGMMTKLFAVRLAEHGIEVFEIRPGIIETDMTASVKAKYDKLILEDGITPIRRWGRPADVGQAVLAIAEGRLPFSTGQIINVDGGFHLRTL